MEFNKEFFDKAIASLPPEYRDVTAQAQSFDPAPTSNPNPQDYPIIQVSQKGTIKFNPPAVVSYLRDSQIVFDGALPSRFDGRVYTKMAMQDINSLIYNAVYESSARQYIPTPYEINTVIQACRSILIPDSVCFSDPDDESPYTIWKNGQIVAFENGILNTESKQFLPFTPCLYLTSYIHAHYDPSVTTASAKSVLEGIVPSGDTLTFLYEMLGYLFFDTEMYPPALFMLYGAGNTGKSAIENMITEILGNENVSKMGIQQLTSRFGTAELEGKKLNVCGETGNKSSRDTKIDGEMLKRLTDGDRVQVERKGIQPYYIVNTAKMLFCTNTAPDFGDTSSGLYRRLYIIPCRNQQDKKAQIYRLLTDEQSRSWVINKALDGYDRFLARGKSFCVSPQMDNELVQYQTQDSVMGFLVAKFETNDITVIAHRIAEDENLSYATELFAQYKDYCNSLGLTGNEMLKGKKFTEKIRNECNLKKKTVSWVNEYGLRTTREKYIL